MKIKTLKPIFHLANLFARTDKKVEKLRSYLFAANFFRQPILTNHMLPDSCFRFASHEKSRQVENRLKSRYIPRKLVSTAPTNTKEGD